MTPSDRRGAGVAPGNAVDRAEEKYSRQRLLQFESCIAFQLCDTEPLDSTVHIHLPPQRISYTINISIKIG